MKEPKYICLECTVDKVEWVMEWIGSTINRTTGKFIIKVYKCPKGGRKIKIEL